MKLNNIKFEFFLIFFLVFIPQKMKAQKNQKVYYSNGNLQIEREINKDSVPNGKCSFYHENGNLMGHGLFNKGKWSGVWEFYNSDGTLDEIGNHENGLRNGKWYRWNFIDTDTIVYETNYKNGSLDGESIVKKNNIIIGKQIYNEGIITELINYSDSINSSLYYESELIDILILDSIIYYSQFDKKTWEMINKVNFFELDTLLYKNYKSEEHTFYDKLGIPVSQKTIFLNNKGQVVKMCSYSLLAEVIEKGEKRLVENGSYYLSGALCVPPDIVKGKKEFFFDNGKCFLKYEVRLDEGGTDIIVISSPFELFYPNGNLYKTGQFTCCEAMDFNKIGIWIEYDINGKIISEENY